MSKVYQLYRELISGVDWHDMAMIEQPMCEMPDKNEEKVKEMIFNDIVTHYPGIDENAVKAVLNGTMDKYCFIGEQKDGVATERFVTLEDAKNSWEYWELFLREKNDTSVFQEVRVSFQSQFEYNVTYWVDEISNPKYFVVETIGAPFKGCMEARKILAGPFDTREEANATKDTVQKHEYDGAQDVDVFGIDISKPSAQEWLNCASEILELEQKFETIEERNKYFIGDNRSHLRNLRAHFGIETEEE